MCNLNTSVLIPHLHKEGLLDLWSTEISATNSESDPRMWTAQQLVDLILEKGSKACTTFLHILQNENGHLGHKYVLSLLMGFQYADEEEIRLSSRIKERIMMNMPEVVNGMNLKAAVIDHMYKKKLLTDDEFESFLQSSEPSCKMSLRALKLLDTKGPTAHLIFAQCLKAETTHGTHQEIFEIIYKDEARLQVCGELLTKEYSEIMKTLRQYHDQGQWEAADELVKDSQRRNHSIEFRVAILLEHCAGFNSRLNRNRVIQTVQEAKELCSTIGNNCKTFLSGRCECTLAMMYLYLQEMDKAFYHIVEARHIQNIIQAGEDTALTNYCYGCYLSELVLQQPDPQMKQEAERVLGLAIDHASSGHFGIDSCHYRLQLAQLYLGSSLYSPGRNSDDDSLRNAQRELLLVGRNLSEASSLRTQCPYYYTMSDLIRIQGDLESARNLACKALGIAAARGFAVEIKSANSRLQACLITQQTQTTPTQTLRDSNCCPPTVCETMASGGTDVTGKYLTITLFG